MVAMCHGSKRFMHYKGRDTMSDYTTVVKSGIDILDGHFGGRSWAKNIDLDNLDLGSCGVCVLGQLFGDYAEGLEELGLSGGYRHGFDTSSGSFRELTAAWKEALGENKVLVEQGDVYKDSYGYAVKVLQTHILTVDGVTTTSYVAETGKVVNGAFKRSYVTPDITLLKKSDFEKSGAYPTKVNPFKVKAGMFLTNDASEVFYAISDQEVREVKDSGRHRYVTNIDQTGLRELVTYMGNKFSDKLVK